MLEQRGLKEGAWHAGTRRAALAPCGQAGKLQDEPVIVMRLSSPVYSQQAVQAKGPGRQASTISPILQVRPQRLGEVGTQAGEMEFTGLTFYQELATKRRRS